MTLGNNRQSFQILRLVSTNYWLQGLVVLGSILSITPLLGMMQSKQGIRTLTLTSHLLALRRCTLLPVVILIDRILTFLF